MKNFFVVSNTQKDINLSMGKQVKAYLEERGAFCMLRQSESDAVAKDTECIIVLGGDGTLLAAVQEYYSFNIPFLGINIGTLGYLTEGDSCSTEEILDAVLSDCYQKEERMMLDGTVIRGGRVMASHVALNDIVVSRSGAMKVIDLKIYVNDMFLCSYRADGMIVSTPTGSTAYNLSAGGPIVEPGASLFVLTPVSPHTMNNRSLILSKKDSVKITVDSMRYPNEPRAESTVYFDGEHDLELIEGDYVFITRAPESITILKLSEKSFIETLRMKLS